MLQDNRSVCLLHPLHDVYVVRWRPIPELFPNSRDGNAILYHPLLPHQQVLKLASIMLSIYSHYRLRILQKQSSPPPSA